MFSDRLLLCSTYNAVENVERRLKVEMRTKAVHLEQHLEYEQTEKHELGVICTRTLNCNRATPFRALQKMAQDFLRTR